MNYLGIDASLRRTGLCFYDGKKFHTRIIDTPEKLKGMARLAWLDEQFAQAIERVPLGGVALEGYAFGVRGGRLADLAEWGSLIRMRLYRCEHPTIIVPPMTMKKYLVNGKLEKNKIMLEVYKQYGVECATDDEADAVVLAAMAANKWGSLPIKNQRQAEALEKSQVLISSPIRVRRRVK